MARLPKGKAVLPLPPFKAWLASNIPAVYDNTMTYYEELCALIKYLQSVVLPALNENAAAVTVISNAVEQLQKYVEDYFKNLDVQEEINNKLDEMSEDGTLADIIANFIQKELKIYAPDYDEAGDLAVYEFDKNDDKKLLIVDFGQYSADAYNKLKTKLVAKGYTKFDYAIITHYHQDHVGMLPYMVADSTFDFSETQFYLPVTPDYSQFVGSTRYIPQMESDIKELLNNNNITYHIASDSTELTILDDFTIKFFNTDLTDFTTYYNITTTHPDTGDTPVTNYNNFSMVNLIEFDGKRVLLTGDIEEGAEAHLAPIIKVTPDVLKVEHHARNYTVDQTYLNTICKAKINFVMLNRTEVQPYVLSEDGQLYHTNYSGDINIVVNQYNEYATSENGALASNYTKFELDNVCDAIPAGADLNDYTYPCDKVVQSSAVAATITNTPTTGHAYRLISIAKNYANRMIQFAIENVSDVTYTRLYNQGVWTDWRVMQTGGTNLEIQSGDLNDLATGDYYISNAYSSTVTNIPAEFVAKRVKVSVNNFGNDGSVTQLASARVISGGVQFPVFYWRVKHQGQSFSNWYRFSNLPYALATGTDLDNIEDAGVYASGDATTTASITNKPSDLPPYAFNLEVIKATQAANRTIQRITSISATMATYIRIRESGGWTNWFKYNLTELS